jgi:sialic acid synthase SpsE
MRIGPADTDERVVLVAEIGNNHEGDVAVARELVRAAAEVGADVVKLQTFRTEHYVSRADETRFARLKSFELPPDGVAELSALARSLGLGFVSTPFDLGSARLLEPLVDAYKISSGDLTFRPLLALVAATERPLILATGMADLALVESAVAFVRAGRNGLAPVALLHAVSAYPTPDEQASLRAIPQLAPLADVVGYSDHTLGTDAAVVAVALGARIVEKHFTLDKGYSEFRDHALSADPPELRELVERVRRAERMLAGGKSVQPGELETQAAARRSVVAGRDLPRGHRLTRADVDWIRPAGGLAPGEEEALLGRPLVRAVRAGEQLRPEHFGEAG